jgi:hypothetical protein
MVDPLAEDSSQINFVERNREIQAFPATVPTSRSQYPLAFGARTGVRNTFSSKLIRSPSGSCEQFGSRS